MNTVERSRMRRFSDFAAAAAASLLVATSACATVVFSVDTTDDGVDDNTGDGICHTAANTCTLRAAVMQANRVVNSDITIELPAGTYVLGPALNADGDDSGDLNLTAPVSGNPVITITGAGNVTTIIDGNATDRVLSVEFGRSAVIGNVTLRNGRHTGPGGGIFNGGVLTLTDVVVRGNSSNSASYCGGGIYNGNQLGIYRSTVASNGSGAGGGGVCNELGAGLTLVNSTIHANESVSDGAGILNLGVCIARNSSIGQNVAIGSGGGILNAGTCDAYNSTIAFNHANWFNSGGTGGGIYNCVGCTFNLHNTVVAGNYLVNTYPDDCAGTLGSYGRNRFWTAAGCVVNQVGPGGSGLLVSLAELGALRDNGGPTRTYALVPPSDMIDGSEPTVGCVDQNGSPLTTDQRGRPRAIGARCDIGAFEYDPDGIFLDGFQ